MAGQSAAYRELMQANGDASAAPSSPLENARERPYQPIFAAQAMRFAMLGITQEDMADAFGVGISTFQRWQVEYPALAIGLRKGGKHADAEVAARGLYRRAVGMTVKKRRKVIDGATGDVLQVIESKEELPPDTNAAMSWLANRQGKLWRASSAGDVSITLDLDAMVGELEQRRQKRIGQRPGDDAQVIDADTSSAITADKE